MISILLNISICHSKYSQYWKMLTHQRSRPSLLNEARTLGCPDRKRWLVHCSRQDSITSQGRWWSWSPHGWGWVLSEQSVVSGTPGWLCVSTWRLLLSWSLYDSTYRFIVLPVFPLQSVLLASWYLSSFIDTLICFLCSTSHCAVRHHSFLLTVESPALGT